MPGIVTPVNQYLESYAQQRGYINRHYTDVKQAGMEAAHRGY